MSQEILKKAITLAIKNGWRGTDDNAPTQWLSTLAKDQVAIDNAGGEDQLFFRWKILIMILAVITYQTGNITYNRWWLPPTRSCI